MAWLSLVAALAVSGCDDEKQCVSDNDCVQGRICVSERCLVLDDAEVEPDLSVADQGAGRELGVVDRGIDAARDAEVDPDADVGTDPDADVGTDPDADVGTDPVPDADVGIDPVPDADVGPACVPVDERCDGTDDDCDGVIDEDAPGYPCTPFVLTGGRITWAAGTSVSLNPAHPYRLEGRGRVTDGATASGVGANGQRFELTGGDLKWAGGIESASDAPGVGP